MWSTPGVFPVLTLNQVHLWSINLNKIEETPEQLIATLSADELERAERYRFSKDRNTYITARAKLRRLIARYLKTDASSVHFLYNDQGKPYIDSDFPLQFNVSHSQDMILIGFTLEHLIGVDIEHDKRSIEIPQIARSFFSKSETWKLLALPEQQQQQAFYNCWTKKEAFIKAKGGGLSIPLDKFEVSLLPEEPARLKAIDWDQQDVASWNLMSFKIGEDYTGASIVHHPSVHYLLLKGDKI